MRLIDADALKSKMHRRHDLFSGCTNPPDKARRDEVLQVIFDIIDAPTADAIPVEWLKRRMEKGLDERFLKGDMEEALIARSCWNVLEVWKREAKA